MIHHILFFVHCRERSCDSFPSLLLLFPQSRAHLAEARSGVRSAAFTCPGPPGALAHLRFPEGTPQKGKVSICSDKKHSPTLRKCRKTFKMTGGCHSFWCLPFKKMGSNWIFFQNYSIISAYFWWKRYWSNRLIFTQMIKFTTLARKGWFLDKW